jgi:hypothetical protein
MTVPTARPVRLVRYLVHQNWDRREQNRRKCKCIPKTAQQRRQRNAQDDLRGLAQDIRIRKRSL